MAKSITSLTAAEIKELRSKELKKGLNALSTIKRHFYSPKRILLNEVEEKILFRLKSIWTSLCEGLTTATVIAKHMEACHVEQSQAWNDLRDSKELFGDPKMINKNADAAIASEMALNLYTKAIEDKDYKGAAAALANYIKARGVDKNDPDIPDWSKIKIAPIQISIPPEQLQMMKDFMDSSPVINFTTNRLKAEDIAFEEE